MTVPLPLLSLLSIHRLSILRYFDFLDVISMSLASRRVRQHIKWRYDQSRCDIVLDFSHTIAIRLFTHDGRRRHTFYFKHDSGALITHLDHHIGSVHSSGSRWRRPEYRVMDWLRHFMETFRNNGIREINIYRDHENQFDLDSIRRNIQNYGAVLIDRRCAQKYALEIVECFSKSSNNRLILRDNPYEKREDLQKFWAQSQEYHVVSSRLATNYSLNDLLITNSSFITINASIGMKLTVKCINRFFKLWIKGACPRLKYLNFYHGVFGFVRVEDVLKGIKYTETSDYRIREFEAPNGELRVLNGGCDIRRDDGTLATVTSETDCETLQKCVKLIVWRS